METSRLSPSVMGLNTATETQRGGEPTMAKIKVIGVQKADNENPPHFELAYVDLERKKNDKGYFQTAKFDTEAHLRDLMKANEVPDDEIDAYFTI